MRYVFTTLMVLIALNSYCCKCKTISKESEYMNSDYILIGQIHEVKESSFLVKPIEYLKGDHLESLVVSIEACSISPQENEIWLIYAKEIDSNVFYISQCGWSRPLNQSVFGIEPPPPINNEKIDEIRTTFYFHERIDYLEAQLDILNLRQIRISNDLKNNGLKKSDFNKIEKSTKMTFILLFITFPFLTLLILAMIFRKYKLVHK